MEKTRGKISIIWFILLICLILSNFPSVFSISPNATHKSKNESIIQIAVVGDILITKQIHEYANLSMNNTIIDPYLRVASGFEALFSPDVVENLTKADLTFGNLETPIAEGLTRDWYFDENGRPICTKIEIDPGILTDENVYCAGERVFNSHPALALALKNIGFELVSTANNHYADRASNGIDGTIDSLRRANLSFVGTLKHDEIIDEDSDNYPDNEPYIILEVRGVKIAFLAFASQLNHMMKGTQWIHILNSGLPKVDEICSRQIYCAMMNNNPIEYNVCNFCNSIEKAKNKSDMVMVSTHFGIWQHHNPSKLQKKYSERFLNSGADVIIGHGPHVLQPIESYITKDGRRTFIIYSLGNFIFNGGLLQVKVCNNHASAIGLINIKNDENSKLTIQNITYIPTFSEVKNGKTTVIIPKEETYDELRHIYEIVFSGTDYQRWILAQYYISRFIGGRLVIQAEKTLDHWIYLKWNLEQKKLNK